MKREVASGSGAGWLEGLGPALFTFSALVGVAAGLLSVFLHKGLELAHADLAAPREPWLRVLLPAAGGLVAAFLLRRVFRVPPGHGVGQVVYSVTRGRGLLSRRHIFASLLASVATIASGGSAGPEAPVVISGASLGSFLTNFLPASRRHRVTLVAAGAAAAIGAIFDAPLAGMFFALEAILGDYRLQHLVPVALAAVVGAETSHLLAGTEPLFFLEAEQRSGWAAAGALPLAIITTLCVLAFLEILSRSERIFSRALRWPLIRAASGGLLVGILGLVDPRILGEGYGVIDDILGGDVTPLLLSLAGLLALKAIATGATLGSGGAGGVFAPSLVLGAVLGLLFAQVVNQAVGRPVLQPEFFALMGMSAFVAGLLHAPLTGTFLAAEITGGFSVLPPMLLVSVMTYTMVRRIRPRSFYHEELGSTTHGHWQSLDQRALASLNLLEVLDPQIPVVPGDTDIPALREVLERSDRRWVIVEDRKAAEEAAGDLAGARLGLIDVLLCRDLLDPSVGFSAGVTARDLVDPRVPCLPDTTSAREVLAAIEAAGVEAALIEHYGTPLGIVEVSALLHLYRLEISVQEHH